VGRWWTRDGRHEVDIVVRGMDGDLFVGECEWGDVTGEDLAILRERAQVIAAEPCTNTSLPYTTTVPASQANAERTRFEVVQAPDIGS
jgi:uncharacterized protein DUF234